MKGIYKRVEKQTEPRSVHRIPIRVYHPLTQTDLKSFIKNLERMMPEKAFQGLKKIDIGNFQAFHDRNISAFTTNDVIYVSNDLSLENLLRATIHELAHFVEKNFWDVVYGDGELEKAFLDKRKNLYHFLKANNKPMESFKLFMNPRFSQKLDDYFYKEIGYDYLNALNSRYNFGPTPYSLTSLNEFFADGFEMFFMGQTNEVKKSCVSLYNKLHSVLSTLEG